MDGVENKLTNEELKQSYEKVFQELNEVQTGLNGKEKIEGLSGILTATLLEELEKPENKKVKDSLKDAYQTIINNSNLSRRAGDGLREVGVFLGGKSEKFGEDIKEDYDEFMKKLLNPEKLSRMNRDEVAKVKLYLSDKTHEQDAYKMYESIRKESVKYESLKGQDREFIDEVWKTLKTNYENADYFMEKEYGKISQDVRSLQKFCRNVDVKNWEGSNLKMEDVTSWHKESFVPHKKVVDKFNEMNKKRIAEIEKNVLEKIDLSKLNFTNENLLFVSFLNYIGKLDKNENSNIMSGDIRRIFDDLRNNEKFKNKIKTHINQVTNNNIYGIENGFLDKINRITISNNFIEKNGENVTYHPDKAAGYLKELVDKGIQWSTLEKKNKDNGERQAWIAAVQVLLNNDKELGDPIKVTGEYEAKDGDLTYDKVIVFQKAHSDEFGEDKGRGWKVDGKPGQNVINVLLKDQGNREIEHKKLSGDIAGIGKFENGEFKFNDGIFKNGIATIDGKDYKEYMDNMKGLGYSTGQDNGEFGWMGLGYSYLYMGNFENGERNGEGTLYFTNGDIYQGHFSDGKVNGEGTYTWVNGREFVGNMKNGNIEGSGRLTFKENGEDYNYVGNFDSENNVFKGTCVCGKGKEVGNFSIKKDSNEDVIQFEKGVVSMNSMNYEVERDDKGLKITTGEYNGKYIDDINWKIVSGEVLDQGDSDDQWIDDLDDGSDIYEGLYEVKDGKVVLRAQEKMDKNGKYIYIGGKKYYEYSKGMKGFGYRRYPNSALDMGNFKNGKLDGKGIHILTNGDMYDGNFVDGKFVKGTYKWASGSVYKGEFKNGVMEGKGFYKGVNGVEYSGAFKKGKFNGFGIWKLGNVAYDGNFVDGKANGYGTKTFSNGDVYKGEFKEGECNGHGIFTWGEGKRKGDVYDGDFLDDKRTGKGTYKWANGNAYEGEFKEGKIDGRGVKTFASGYLCDGVWKNDEFLDGTLKIGDKDNNSPVTYHIGLEESTGKYKVNSGDYEGKYVDELGLKDKFPIS